MKTLMDLVRGDGRGCSGRLLTLLTGLTVLSGLAYPVAADVIDDYGGARRFGAGLSADDMTSSVIETSSCDIVDGQLRITRPNVQGGTSVHYLRNYELPEGQPVEFRVDYLHASAQNVQVFLGTAFPAPVLPNVDSGYAFFWRPGHVELIKYWADSGCWFINDRPSSQQSAPVTASLTLTREGESLKLRCKVVSLGDDGETFYDRELTDHPGPDLTLSGVDAKAPMLGPVTLVAVGAYSEPLLAGGARSELFLDNLVCSANPSPPRLAIRSGPGGGVTMDWRAVAVPLEADSPLGPWRLCQELMESDDHRASLSTPVTASQRYYRLASGWRTQQLFQRSDQGWRSGSVVARQSLRPGFVTSVSPGWGRVVGSGPRNVDFVLRSELIAGAWYRDCVASVDLMEWDETMEDASLGIVLRAQPAKALWHCQTDGLPRNRYAGMLTFKTAGTTPESVLAITGPGGEVLAESRRFPGLDGGKPYRLQFGAVGERLTLELFDLERPETALLTCRANDGRLDGGMDALYGTKAAGDRYEVFIDRYIVTGVTP